MKLFLAIGLMFFSLVSYTQEAVVYRSGPSAQKAFVISENNIWKVKINSYKAGWPEQIAEYQFKNLGAAQKYLAQYHFLLDSNLIEAQKEKELRGDSAEMIWTPKNTWSWDWELKFANWIQNEVDTDFYQKYNLRTDCADVMYSLRWIFARMNYLPAANKTMDGLWFPHRSSKNEWKDLKTHSEWSKDQRFIAALKYIMQQSYTHTLHKDSYPIALNATSMLPGSFHLIVSGKSGHTMVVYRQFPATDGVRVMIMASTVPRAVRVLSEHMIYPSKFDPKSDSIRRMRWPIVTDQKVGLVEPEKMPYYSLEQFSDKDINVNRILNPNPNWQVEYDQALASLLELLNQRKTAVEMGFKACAPNKCATDSTLYDQHSTPSRDRRLKQALNYIESEIAQNYTDYDKRKSEEKFFDLFNEKFTLLQVSRVLNSSLFSSNPNDEMGRRWLLGVDNYPRIHKEELVKNLVLRRAKIQKALKECRSIESCSNQSKDFETYNLYTETQMALSLNQILKAYYSEEQKDAEYQQYIMTTISDGQKQMPVTNWLSLLQKSATDPRAVPSMLEGDWSELFYHLELPEKTYINRIEKNWIVLTYEYKPEMTFLKKITLEKGQLKLQSAGLCSDDDKIESENLERKWVVVLCGQEYRKVNIETGEVLMRFPQAVIGERKYFFVGGKKIVLYQTEQREKPYTYEVLKNVSVYDIEAGKVLFNSSPEDDISSVQVALNGQYLGLSLITGSDDAEVKTEIRNYDLRLPGGAYRISKKIQISQDVKEWYYRDSRDIVISDTYITVTDENQENTQTYSIVQTSQSRINEFLVINDEADRFMLLSLKILPENLQIQTEELFSYKKVNGESLTLNEARDVGVLYEQNLAFSFSETSKGFKVTQSPLQNITWKVDSSYTLKVSVENKKFVSKLYRPNGELVFTLPGQIYSLFPDFLYADHFIYASSDPLYSSAGPSSSRYLNQVLFGNYSYNITSGFVTFDGRFLLLLK